MNTFDIRVSRSAGFCWGVERALEMANQAVDEATGQVASLGPLIHNPRVVADLQAKGVRVVENPGDVGEGTVIIRSHGVPEDVRTDLERRGLEVVDATCRFVKAAQEKAAWLRAQGYTVVILGERDHPEVLALRSYAGPDSLVVEGREGLPATLPSPRLGIVVQTTQSADRLAELAAFLAPRARELLVFNTICHATDRRQRDAAALAGGVDTVFVVGGKDSGNTRRLAELCARAQPHTYHIESPDEVEAQWLASAKVVGVTAGASTPADQIDAVIRRLRELGGTQEDERQDPLNGQHQEPEDA
jgi:4-hydroxy-3-methylbut-2-en-1-yl diphosphate reductase